jgi:hypothetical protein
VAGTAPDSVVGEKFARNGGSFIAVVGGVTVVAFIVGWIVDMDGVSPALPAGALVGGVLLYASTLRPRVLVEDAELVLRNMFTTVRVPLATIEEIVVQQVLAVRAGDRRFVCAGAGRSLRAVMRGTSLEKARSQASSLTGEIGYDVTRGMDYADYVETRVRQMIRADRADKGISSVFSPEADRLRERIRREPAWPELAALGGAVLLLALAILLG